MSRSEIDHEAAVIEHRAACTTCWQDLRELARRHPGLDADPMFTVLDAALERLALPGVTSVARRMARLDAVRKAVA